MRVRDFLISTVSADERQNRFLMRARDFLISTVSADERESYLSGSNWIGSSV